MQEHVSSDISQAVFETLLYSDVFDFPLTAWEIHRYLSGRTATYEETEQVLNSDPRFGQAGQYYTLIGREEIVQLREERTLRSQKLLPHALQYGRIAGVLPFVRMVALTGSLAVGNVSNNEDFDYMLVTQPGRLWTARAFVLLFNRLTRLAGHTLCPNVIVSENALEWRQHDLYSARDLCQMIPVAGMSIYRKLIQANPWVRDFLPNAYEEIIGTSRKMNPYPEDTRKQGRGHTGFSRLFHDQLMMDMPKADGNSHVRILQKSMEFPFIGWWGDRFEAWEMNRKIARFSRQEGFGEETIFNADICQGNFDHHRRWTQQQLGKRGRTFEVEASFHEGKLT